MSTCAATVALTAPERERERERERKRKRMSRGEDGRERARERELAEDERGRGKGAEKGAPVLCLLGLIRCLLPDQSDGREDTDC